VTTQWVLIFKVQQSDHSVSVHFLGTTTWPGSDFSFLRYSKLTTQWVLILLYLKNVLYRRYHNVTWVCVYIYIYIHNITVLIYSCVLTKCNTLYNFVTTQWDGFCQKENVIDKILTICTAHTILVGWSNQGWGSRRGHVAVWGAREICTEFWWGNLKERDQLQIYTYM